MLLFSANTIGNRADPHPWNNLGSAFQEDKEVAGVIVDTSTLIGLSLAAQEQAVPPRDTVALWHYHGDIDGGINAIVLYEDILVDQASVDRNLGDLPMLEAFAAFASHISGSPEASVYSAIEAKYLGQVQGSRKSTQLFGMHTDASTAREVGVARRYPSATWRDIERELGPGAKQLARGLREKLAPFVPSSGAACALLLRTLYYDELQRRSQTDLILHPAKAIFRDPTPGEGSSVLDVFDERVRKAFSERKRDWLGRDELSVEVPLLSEYVLGQCKAWTDLPKVLADLRHTKQAREFRRGIEALCSALKARDNVTVDKILGQLEAQCQQWEVQLGILRRTKKIRLSVPLIGVSTEVDIPDNTLSKSAADKIIGFVHLLLSAC